MLQDEEERLVRLSASHNDEGGQSRPSAVATHAGSLLTLFLGWIGLAIVYFGQTRTRDTMESVAARVAAAPPRPPAAPPATATAPPRPGAAARVDGDAAAEVGVEERLRRLDRLRSDDLLTEDEYQQQRQRILSSL